MKKTFFVNGEKYEGDSVVFNGVYMTMTGGPDVFYIRTLTESVVSKYDDGIIVVDKAHKRYVPVLNGIKNTLLRLFK